MARNRKIVPALMFHSVGLEKHPWAWSYISESLETFEGKISALRKKGFNGVFWHELYDHMAGRKELPDDSILLTFDDGYLDNWVHVYPILKKYGMKGTIFVSPDFTDPATDLRPNLEDVSAGRVRKDELDVAGFLSWAEMREMERSGLIDIQSHAMTHTWYFSGPGILAYHRPHEVTPYPWLLWNARPDRKPYYLSEDQQEFLPWGYPILEHQKSLIARRFIPEQQAVDAVTGFVAAHGGREYFQRPDWQSLLQDHVVSLFTGPELPGSFESVEACKARITSELQQSKALIERHLGKEIDFVCWPGGGTDESVEEIAKSVGYKSWTLSSRSMQEKRNRPGVDPSSIKRIGTSNQVEVKGRRCGTAGPQYQVLNVLAHQGSTEHDFALKAYKLVKLGVSLGGSR